MTPAAQGRIEITLLVAAAAVVWRSAFQGVFQFDDFAAIVQDNSYRTLDNFFSDLAGRIRPAARVSYLIDRLVFGIHPAGYHLQSVLLHAGSGLLLYGIVRRARCGGNTVAFFAALLFLVHPIACETVTYLSGRPSGLSAFLQLLALRLYIQATPQQPGERMAPLLLAASVVCFALAVGAKETAAAFPLLLLIWDVFGRGQGGPSLRTRLRFHAPYWAVLAAAIVVASLAIPRYRELAAVSLALGTPWANLFAQAKPLTFVLLLFVRPASLNVDHDMVAAPFGDPVAWAAVAALVGLFVAALVAARRAGPVAAIGFGVLWFFAAAVAANGPVARLDLLSERNLYLPLAGLAVAAAGIVAGLVEAVPRGLQSYGGAAIALIALLAVVALGVATVERNALWSDPVALWTDAVAKSPHKSRAHNNLGHALERRGDLDGAIREYRRALDLEPANQRAWNNLRRVWDAAGAD